MHFSDKNDIIQMTPLWKGERFPDGRPKVSDEILDRFKKMPIEDLQGVLMGKFGYRNMFVGNLKMLNPSIPAMVGRAVTAAMLPTRPDLKQVYQDIGKEEGRHGGSNQWVIDILQERDVCVVDLFDKVQGGTFIGGNLAKAVEYNAKDGGIVICGGIRDLLQAKGMKNLQVFYRDDDPAGISEVDLSCINMPVRMGTATCLPGDVVLANEVGVLFIPPHIAEEALVLTEMIALKDEFCFERIDDGTYRIHQVHSRWTMAIYEDFLNWFKTSPKCAAYQYLNWDEEVEQAKKYWEEQEAK